MKNQCKSKHLFYVLCLLLTAFSSYAQNDVKWHVYELDKLSLNEPGVYVDTPTISGKTYVTKSATTLKASSYDRMLFIVEGMCTATVKSEAMNLKTGDVVFLKADDAIKFSGSLKTMIWTSKSTKTNHQNKTKKFSKAEIEAERDASENVWNSFIETSTMVAGLYMLPKSLNGDNTLTHSFDEINYVVNGSAKFKMNDTVIDVKPGSMMWVKRGVGHYFYDLSADFDVFILFETINMDHDH
ncbi:cupin domain-containing protein [Flagellimonas myxillae]|uniref:cupin domain-containing protein n=1 Tax=Flagellimonas myxillae TaxID=2942214 RepID=UPI00201F2497|nr:cupin domain-containing protein [Muricauda myxillae]MCL6265966.1 cupin domain-containing protein [Muricauda myxillae]